MASKLARRLDREMKRRELSYREFAEELGVTASQLHDWVHDAQEPRLGTLRELAKKLDCNLFELIDAA